MNDEIRSAARTLEAVTRTLEQGGAEAMAQLDSEETARAREVIQRESFESLEFVELLERYRRARSELSKAPPTVEVLPDVLYSGRLLNWGALIGFGLLITVFSFYATRKAIVPKELVPVFALAFVIASIVTAPKIRVTKTNIVVGDHSFAVADVRAIRTRRVETKSKDGSSWANFLEVEFHDGRTDRVKMNFMHPHFIAAIEKLGFPVVNVS